MGDSKKISFPVNLLILDIVGAVLLALGVAEFFGVTLASEFLSKQFNLSIENIKYHLLVIGVLFMVPLPVYYMKKILKQKQDRFNS